MEMCMCIGDVFGLVERDAISENEIDGCMIDEKPLKKLDFPSPFLPRMILMWGLRLLISYSS
jgi:hypothetical protein